ncbi:unnamed protein product [Cylicocyclus nassatus]|uniref:Uncharacterized protein n=1 Tax=Cylicocyclus nassatus TaxID=53992 RepID=A0AA36MC86_CYLNA|nr:unnamed protein product [Cylicocyclus nassatus]
MVDLMASPSDYQEPRDFEDGELPEDGEICDDDEEPKAAAAVNNPSPSPSANVVNQPSAGASPNQSKIRTAKEMIGASEENAKPSQSMWASKVAAAEEKVGDVFGYGAEDKDYRFEEEGSGDFDYRQGSHVGRRRRHSPQHDEDWDMRGPKRPYGGRGFRGFRPKPQTATTVPIPTKLKTLYAVPNSANSTSKEDEMYANRSMGGPVPMKRRVLLPQGPSGAQPPLPPTTAAPVIHAAVPQQPSNGGPLAPPSVVVPSLTPTPPPFPAMPPRLPYYAAPTHAASPRFEEAAAVPGVIPTSQPTTTAPPTQFNISQMLAQIAGDSIADDESPASPPMGNGSTDSAVVRQIPEGNVVAWRLIAVDAPPTYSGVTPDLNLTSQDPRMNRVMQSQFDAVSSLIAGTPSADSSVSRTDLFRPEERRPSDDRPRASSWMPQMA